MSAASLLRRILRGSDLVNALEGEAAAFEDERRRTGFLPDQLRSAFSSTAVSAATIGYAVDGGWPVRILPQRLEGHTALWGPSGSGKSRLVALMLLALLRAGLSRLCLLDPKAETVELAKRAILAHALTLPPGERERLLDRVVLLDLFATSTLPRLQVLSAEEGLDPEVQAFSVANLCTRELDNGGIGVRQEAILHRVIEALIRSGLPLTVLPTALETPQLFDALSERHAPSDLFRMVATRLRRESRERILGLASRAERLLRLRSVRLALGGTADRINFNELLDERLTLLNLAPPHGSSDIARFLAGLIWVQLTHAIRRRPNGSPPAYVIVDEAPTFWASGGEHLADTFEDVLRLSRSKGVYLITLSQDTESVAKVSRSLLTTVQTNVHTHAVFRATDPNAWDFVLPVTGCRPKPSGAPWEEQRFAYLERSSELSLLREELARLPDRHAYLLDRRTGLPALLLRTADLRLDVPEAEVRALEARAAGSDAVATITELERGEQKVRDRIRELLGTGGGGGDEGQSLCPPRGGRRPMEIG